MCPFRLFTNVEVVNAILVDSITSAEERETHLEAIFHSSSRDQMFHLLMKTNTSKKIGLWLA